jgi:glucose-6-phosphate isomerase
VSTGLDRTIVVVSSKSGSTVETDSQRRAFVTAFAAAGIDAASRIVLVTDPGSALEELGRDEGYRAVVLADPNVGGRYSALTAFGLVPSALAGVDVLALLDEAAAAAPQLAADDPSNPALTLGAALGGTGSAGEPRRDKVAILDVGGGLPGFGDWAEQLIAESTGKEGTGILPVVVEDDAPEIRWPAVDVLTAAVAADESSSGPDTHLTVVGTLGGQLLLWETATAVAGRLLGINPFDQPDVESAKTAARGLLDATPEAEPPLFTDVGIEVRGDPKLFGSVSDVAAAVGVLVDQLAEDGYLAEMVYLDRHRDAELSTTRQALALRTERPTTFGWGPRFLHSTGQYHKGGSPQGVFLQVTGAADADLEIADRPYTFGQLLSAQAAGDAKVLAEHGRPVLRLHLTDRAAGVAHLLEVLR